MNLPFGKYRGEDILDVPLDYLEWLEEQDWFHEKSNKELIQAVQHEIKRRTGDRSSLGRVVPGKINVKIGEKK